MRASQPQRQSGEALPPGLDATERAALERAGAFGTNPVHLLIVGDSIALTLGMGLSLGAQKAYGVTVKDNGGLGCDLDAQLEISYQGHNSAGVQGCAEWQGLWPLLVAAQRPQVVALGLGRWEVADHFWQGRWVHIGQPAWDAHLTSELVQAVAVLHSFGARVVLFTMPYVHPPQHLANGKPFDENVPDRARLFNALVRQVASNEPNEVTLVDLNHLLAPSGVYAPSVDGVRVRSSDGIHVSLAGGILLQRDILPLVARIGLDSEMAVSAAATTSDESTVVRSRTQG